MDEDIKVNQMAKQKPKNEKEPGIHKEDPKSQFFNKRFKFSMWYFIAIIIVMMLLNSALVKQGAITEIDYNQFKEAIKTDRKIRAQTQRLACRGNPLPDRATVRDGKDRGRLGQAA
jgi:magnesium-transporting ATPase (P-type)